MCFFGLFLYILSVPNSIFFCLCLLICFKALTPKFWRSPYINPEFLVVPVNNIFSLPNFFLVTTSTDIDFRQRIFYCYYFSTVDKYLTVTTTTVLEFFKMFSFSSGVAVISLFYPFEYFLLHELLFILDYYTAINNNYYHHYYPYKFKKKKYKTEILTLKLISKLLLLFLVTMAGTTTATHAVAATLLKGIILRFRPHKDLSSYPVIHESFNSVYGVDVYNDEFHFIFDDVPTNGAKALFKHAPERLRKYMVDHIKQVSGATGRASRSETDKIDKLFGKIELSYALNTGKL